MVSGLRRRPCGDSAASSAASLYFICEKSSWNRCTTWWKHELHTIRPIPSPKEYPDARNPYALDSHQPNLNAVHTRQASRSCSFTRFSAPGRFPRFARLTASSKLFSCKNGAVSIAKRNASFLLSSTSVARDSPVH